MAQHEIAGFVMGPEHDLSGRQVLVIEDEYYLAEDLARALRRRGAQIAGPIGTLAEARRFAASVAPIDAAVLDLKLHDENAMPVADLLAARGIPFVFVTGYDAAATPERHRRVPHWSKPYNLDTVVGSVAALLP